MQNDEVMLQCPNDLCKAANPEGDKFCQRCGTSLIKRYLWAVGDLVEICQIGELVAERYLLKSDRVFLDTKPGLVPEAYNLEISNAIKPYLRLVTYQLQVPQVYGFLPVSERGANTKILLLEQAPIYTDAVPQEGQLMPELFSAWKEASSLRQLNWLWQIAQLWQPFSSEGVASSLLVPQLLRVEGSLVRLLQLQVDDSGEPTLSQLGQLLSHLAVEARQSIAEFLQQLSQALQQGEVQSAEQLIACLDRGLAELGQSSRETALTPGRIFKISTCTDTGPSRQRNEDACYPVSGTTIAKPPEQKAIAIVCDGIGGHEGGNVASNLAIETLQQQVEHLPLDDANLSSVSLSSALERFACMANDRISQRNDKEQRQGRQRMGTTLVMAVGHRHEIYIAHVGDSRAYWITRTGCHQITLDDDVAAREVKLGYAIYRDALQQPSAGSLVQAMGMSGSIHPTVQRFVLDEDCVVLLCSDGLSDFDLVEQCWQTEILPILEGRVDVATASQRLVEVGNTRNGHDNITVALAYCQVNFCEPETSLSYSLATEENVSELTNLPTAATVLQETQIPKRPDSDSWQDTQLLPSRRSSRPALAAMLVGISLLISLSGGLLVAYLASQGKLPRQTIADFIPSDRRLSDSASPSPSPSPTPVTSVEQGTLLVAKRKTILDRTAIPDATAFTYPDPQRFSPIKGILPAGSVVQVLTQQSLPQLDNWLNLKVCSIPNAEQTSATTPKPTPNNSTQTTQKVQPSPTVLNSPEATTGSRLLQPGEDGWIQATNIKQYLSPPTGTTPNQLGTCYTSAPTDTPVTEPTTSIAPKSATVEPDSYLKPNQQKTR
jgi:protein phosphatase